MWIGHRRRELAIVSNVITVLINFVYSQFYVLCDKLDERLWIDLAGKTHETSNKLEEEKGAYSAKGSGSLDILIGFTD